MIRTVLRPWRPSTLWGLAYLATDVTVGWVPFAVVAVILAVGLSFLASIVLSLAAVPILWLGFALAEGLGRVGRSRAAALLGVELAYPHQPLTAPSRLGRMSARLRSASRWREIAYLLVEPLVGGLLGAVAITAWAAGAVLAGLPLFGPLLPDRRAHFGIVTFDAGRPWATLLGAAVLAVVAPWLTVTAVAAVSSLARNLLAARPEPLLAARVAKLEESRGAAVAGAETERQRIERDLHDGAQQRLVSLAMELGRARESFDADPERARALIGTAHDEAKAALSELRDLVRGIHPAVLSDRGLDAALSAVVARCPVPVDLRVELPRRLPAPVESAAYFVVTEALTNVARHSGATRASVSVAAGPASLVVDVRDDGHGGADPSGSGLAGLDARVRALEGWMTVISPPGGPTSVIVEIPCAS
ncbi:sensor domain-containing protein [Acidiferrimicrobium sp. IK]|uniref:sensor histidine kinase n=1 Tax=Acidiferrimicrobium sp. IK TaxID=2871700 RepID=UPI0021CB01AC|nr:sensor histidine kinase [Acidiferrimicrobium sp. IK]MCU4184774.1 sensor domain-containing protein [Acidiferrimicrobium sp. IK]